MTNNDILRRIRYVFDLKDSKMIAIFALADLDVSREQVSNWLKKDDDASYVSCNDTQMATFLNGFITERRGAKDGPKPVPESTLTNNIIFRKLKIAMNLQNEDVLDLMQLAGLRISKHELSAFFRRIDHKHHRVCKDQILRNFLQGLQLKHRPAEPGADVEFVEDSSDDLPDDLLGGSPGNSAPAKSKPAESKPVVSKASQSRASQPKPSQPRASQQPSTAQEQSKKSGFDWNINSNPKK